MTIVTYRGCQYDAEERQSNLMSQVFIKWFKDQERKKARIEKQYSSNKPEGII